MEASEVLRLLTTAAFVILTAAAFREWRIGRARAAGWFALSFLLIALVAVSGYVLPEDSDSTIVAMLQKATIVGLVLSPYLLYRLTKALHPTPTSLDVIVAALTVASVLATLAVPASVFMEESDRSGWFAAYLALLLTQFTAVSLIVAARLWRAGREEPALPRRRVRALALAAVGLSAALLVAATESPEFISQLLALGSAALFFVGFATPRILRRQLGGYAEERFRSAVAELMGATTAEDVTRTLLTHATEAAAGRGASLLDRDGDVIATHRGYGPKEGDSAPGEDPRGRENGGSDPAGEPVELPLDSSTLVVWVSPFTPVFGRKDLDALTSLGRLAELAIERSELFEREREAHDALRRQIDFSRMLVDSSVDGIMAFDRNYRYTLWNQGMERIAGMSREDVVGRSAFEVFPFLKEIGEDRFFDEALAGRDATSLDRRYDIPDTGAQGFFEARYSPLHGEEGDVVGGLAIIRDVTDRKRAESEREQRQREEVARAAAEARNRMVENLQAVTDTALGHLTLDAMVSELVERIRDMLQMDVAALALLEDDGETLLVRAAVGFTRTEPEGTRIPRGSAFFGRVVDEGGPVAIEDVVAADMNAPLLEGEQVRSVMGAPMIVGGRLVGAVEVGRREPYRFTEADRGWLQLVADRVALAVEQASIYEREHRIAETLQLSLLPESLPDLPGLEIAARYRAGGAGAVGGDWYDVISLPRGRVGLAMGDVVGHGIGAASLMGQMRSALRAYALEDDQPSSVIGRLDRLLQSMGPTGMATLLYLVLDRDSSSLSFATAGHPPPIVRGPDEQLRYLETAPSVPLGVQSTPRFDEREFEFPPGSALILYTDGLIERRGATLEEGFERLQDTVRSAPDDPEAMCDHIVGGLLPENPGDDTAVLVVQSAAAAAERLVVRRPAEPAALASVRDAVRRWLGGLGLDEQDAYDVLVASGEACANAIEHAYGPGEAAFELEAWVDNGEIEILVRDFGEWREPRGQERGRGLGLMRQLMDRTEVTRAAEGTTVRLRRAVNREVTA